MIRAEYEKRLEIWEQWDHLAVAAQGGVKRDDRFGFESTALEVVEGIDLTGKRAIVTGGASGIGIETARALASAGAEVTLAVRDVDRRRAGRDRDRRDRRQLPRPRQPRVRRRVRRAAGTARCTSSSTTRA